MIEETFFTEYKSLQKIKTVEKGLLPDVDMPDLSKAIYAMVDKGVLTKSGVRTYRKYRLA